MKAKIVYRIDGDVVTEGEFRRRSNAHKKLGAPQTNRAYEKPLIGSAAGCHASQVPAMNAFLEEKGVSGARFLPDGRVRFESRQARNEFCRARGLIDQDGGYGDVTQTRG